MEINKIDKSMSLGAVRMCFFLVFPLFLVAIYLDDGFGGVSGVILMVL